LKVHIGRYHNYNKKTKKTLPRKISIKLDRWDTWSAYDTIGMLVEPLLIQLKKTKHGAPYTDDEDVPERLRSTSAKKKGNPKRGEIDSNHFKRWDWILGEMIWAFKQLHTDFESKFHHGKIDIKWVKNEDGTSTMTKGPKDTHYFDREGYEAHVARMTNGLKLFAKYAMGLWD